MKWIWMLLLMVATTKADEVFDRANADYRAGRFREAAAAYESLLDRDGPSVGVLQNLGSAYHQLGDDGRAILAFERALLLAPRNPDLKANVKRVRDRAAVFPMAPESRAEKWGGWMAARTGSWLALLGMIALPAAALGWVLLRGKPGRWTMIPVGVGGAVLAAGSWLMLQAWQRTKTEGIVVARPATVRISPFETAEEKASLPAGREVILGAEKDGWFWVRVEGADTRGWVAASEVEPLVPR
ncbi:tetratricopeptide repeat protein [Haloferula sargassicola]|uniref:Tetratricopeptide repeat protein n=1 Tax=Haloferula sargassicola TaxID=490096 RepID=A0ABP9UK68_9BACT